MITPEPTKQCRAFGTGESPSAASKDGSYAWTPLDSLQMLHETRQRRRSAVLRAKRIPEETLAAAKILIQDGQLTISQISKRLGISVSTIYLRYPSARRTIRHP